MASHIEEIEPASRRQFVKRIIVSEVRLRADDEHRRHDDGEKERVNPGVLEEALRAQSEIEQRVFAKQCFEYGKRNEHVSGDAREYPPTETP